MFFMQLLETPLYIVKSLCYNKLRKSSRGRKYGRYLKMSEKNDGLMWALVKEKPEEGLWMKRVPIPEVGPNDV